MTDKANWSWDEFLRERWKREDEGVARRFAPYAYLGKGHTRLDLVKVKLDSDKWYEE